MIHRNGSAFAAPSFSSVNTEPRLPLSLPPLLCTVRNCAQPLERRDRAFVCPARHSHDVARSGYVNLLQPQDRRSRRAGDSREAVAARDRLLAAGVGATILDGIARLAASLDVGPEPVVVDLGSGSGDLLGALARIKPIAGVGIDLSTAAVEHAARRFPGVTWVVANADRRLPLADGSVRLVLSVHGRRNRSECLRVLSHDGFLLAAVPAPDDLVELRTFVDGQPAARDRGAALIDEHAGAFGLVDRTAFRERHRLERDALVDLLRGTYRGERRSVAARVEALTGMDVTLASDVMVFAPA